MLHPLLIPVLIGILGVGFGLHFARSLAALPAGAPAAQSVAGLIRRGIQEYFHRLFGWAAAIAAVLFVGISIFLPLNGFAVAMSFLLGAATSAAAVYFSVNVATAATGRMLAAAAGGINPAFQVGRRAATAGSVVALGLLTAGLGGLLYFFFAVSGQPLLAATEHLAGFAFGAAFTAVFARVAGGIFAKGADIGCDTAARKLKLSEDDAKNPAAIADGVGDIAGDAAGATADFYAQLAAGCVAVLLLAANQLGGDQESITAAASGVIQLPFALLSLGILILLVASAVARQEESHGPIRGWFTALAVAAGAAAGFGGFATWILTLDRGLFGCLLIGIIAAKACLLLGEYFTAAHRRPSRQVAAAAADGAGLTILAGLSTGMLASLAFAILLGIVLLASFHAGGGAFGVAVAGLGFLSVGGVVLAMNIFGPVADTAFGAAEMARAPAPVRAALSRLDAAGNTLSAVTKSYVLAAGALTAVILLQVFDATLFAYNPNRAAGLALTDPRVLAGVLLGGAAAIAVAGFALRGAAAAAMHLFDAVVAEIRSKKIDHARVVLGLVGSALRGQWPVLAVALLVPALGLALLGVAGLSGYLLGLIAGCVLLAVGLAMAGSSWDNAKKSLPAKASPEEKANAQVGDTVGDAAKDAAAPALSAVLLASLLLAILAAREFATFAGWLG